jgi:hypothetical protein
VDAPAVGLKVAMNTGRLESVFLVGFVVCQLALNLAFVENMLADIICPNILIGFGIKPR